MTHHAREGINTCIYTRLLGEICFSLALCHHPGIQVLYLTRMKIPFNMYSPVLSCKKSFRMYSPNEIELLKYHTFNIDLGDYHT